MSSIRPQGSGPGGACTQSFLSVLEDSAGERLPFIGTVVKQLHKKLQQNNFDQFPEVTSSYSFNPDTEVLAFANTDGNRDQSLKRMAMCIGINYPHSQCPLSGCQNDAESMVKYLASHGFDFSNSDLCKVMIDDGENIEPTKQAIHDGFDWLVKNANSGDNIFISFVSWC